MGRPVENALGGFKVDLSHQEVERLLSELEEWYNSTPAEWIATEAAASWLRHDLGATLVGDSGKALLQQLRHSVTSLLQDMRTRQSLKMR